VPSLRHVVHWGLCDGASAIAIHAASDPRPYALIMVNPWVRSDESLAKARMKSYYLVHIMQIDFWRRLIRGGVDIKGRLRDFWVNLLRALRKETRPPAAAAPFQDRMSGGLMDFAGSVLLILSGRDITAAEFDTSIRRSHRWERAFRACDVTREIMPDADHTFSNRTASRMAARISAQWIRKL
jgi:exosortase A-associated hydrolase 1